jgi:hypothetical protein
MGIFKKDFDEQEVSGGQVFGYILLGAALLFIIAFIAFVCITKVKGGNDASTPQTSVEQTVDTENTVE